MVSVTTLLPVSEHFKVHYSEPAPEVVAIDRAFRTKEKVALTFIHMSNPVITLMRYHESSTFHDISRLNNKSFLVN